jgi:hypothetical protein
MFFHEIQPFGIHLIIIFFLQNINMFKKEGKLKQNTKLWTKKNKLKEFVMGAQKKKKQE